MTQAIFWALPLIGICYTVTESKLFLPFRETILEYRDDDPSSKFWQFASKLVNCPVCLSPWVSSLLSIFLVSPTNNIILDALSGLGLMWILLLAFGEKEK